MVSKAAKLKAEATAPAAIAKAESSAATAILLAKRAAVIRKAAETLDAIQFRKAIRDVPMNGATVSAEVLKVPDGQFVPPAMRERTAIPEEEEIEGNPLNCCKTLLLLPGVPNFCSVSTYDVKNA